MITETDWIHGPFVLIVTPGSPLGDQSGYPMVVEPTDGFPTKEAARKYAEAADAAMEKLGETSFNWVIAQRESLTSFKNFCSF